MDGVSVFRYHQNDAVLTHNHTTNSPMSLCTVKIIHWNCGVVLIKVIALVISVVVIVVNVDIIDVNVNIAGIASPYYRACC